MSAQPCFCRNSQRLGIISGQTILNSNDTITADGSKVVGFDVGAVDKFRPLIIRLINNAGVSVIVSGNVQNAVNIVSFTGNGIVDCDAARGIRRKRRHRHGAQQGNRQQSRHEFFERLLHRL